MHARIVRHVYMHVRIRTYTYMYVSFFSITLDVLQVRSYYSRRMSSSAQLRVQGASDIRRATLSRATG